MGNTDGSNNISQNANKNTSNNNNLDYNFRPENEPLDANLFNNVNIFKKIFCYPLNIDFVIREVHIKTINRSGILLFLQGMVDTNTIEKEILRPLVENNNSEEAKGNVISVLMRSILTGKGVYTVKSFKEATKEIVNGNTILLVQGVNIALVLSTVGYEHRSIEKTTTENTLKGPKEAFVESEQTNRSLVRKYLRDEKLIVEGIQIGKRNGVTVFLMYIVDIANDSLIQEIKQRLNKIEADSVQTISILEQYIEDRPYSLVPTILATERPDRVAAFLTEGHIAIIMDGSPTALIAPITFWSIFQNPEDQYQRWFYGNFTRLIRILACFIALLTPGLFVAITSFHVDMIPTDLVLAIASSREKLPFPAVLEVLLMEIAFELLREAGIRIPTPIGPTIGIVGALILGQAAVEANIVSPILVIVVSITGLSSFAIPEISLSFLIRIARFLFLLAGAFMGFYGIGSLFVVCLAYLSTVKSFGVYFMSPFAPNYKSSKDLIFRPPVWKQWLRPLNIKPKKSIKDRKPQRS